MAISIKAATLVAIIIESILYGISTFLFGITLWALTYHRTSSEVSRLMLAAACMLFILGTMHVVVDAHHTWQGFIVSDAPDAYFQDVTKNTFKNALYELETLLADAILIYRCYVVWRRFVVIIVPIIGWISVAITATHTVWSISQLSPENPNIVFFQQTGQWVISFYSTALVTNAITTSLLAFKLWSVHQSSRGMRIPKSRIYPVLLLILECGALYSLSLFTMLMTYVSASNSSYIVIDMIGQIIPITFCLLIVRTTMLRLGGGTSYGSYSRSGGPDHIPMSRPVRIHIGRKTVIESEIEEVSGLSSGQLDITSDDSKIQWLNHLYLAGGHIGMFYHTTFRAACHI